MNADQVWQSALDQLRMQMTQATFDTWVKGTRVVSQAEDNMIIGTKSAFAKDWLENRLMTTINRTVTNIMGYPVDIKFIVDVDGGAEQVTLPLLPDPSALSAI